MTSRSITLYNLASTGKVKVLKISVFDDQLETEWGYLDGAMQTTVEFGDIKNEGKANEISAEQNAQDLYDRKVKKKKDEGYTEDLGALESAANSPWELPKQFAPAKPKASITDKALTKLIEDRNCLVTLKRDGQRAFLFKMPDGTAKVMSRRMEDYTELVPHLADDLVRNKGIPNGSILDVELVANAEKDNYDYVGSILRSKPGKANDDQLHNGLLIAYTFDVLYWDGEDITGTPYRDRLSKLSGNLFESTITRVDPFLPASLAEVKNYLKSVVADGAEGYVIWDASSTTKIRYDGKPDRKGGAFKMKPVYEDDFYVRGYEMGKGKNAGVVGAIYIFQRDAAGNEIPCGKCGGFAGDSKIRRELLDMDTESGEMVVQVEFASRQKSGALRFPVMTRIREDKRSSECIYVQ